MGLSTMILNPSVRPTSCTGIEVSVTKPEPMGESRRHAQYNTAGTQKIAGDPPRDAFG